MNLKDLTKEELESYSYDDIAYMILSESKRKLKLPDIFKKICKLLELSDSEYEEKIGDFFQMMSTDKRFTMLDKGNWDLKERHQSNIILNTDDEDEEEETEDDIDTIEPEEDEEEDNYYDEDDSEQDDADEDDLKDLVIVTDDEEDEANANM